MRIRALTQSAFSLVEVTIAMALMAFVMMTLMAMIPIGLATNQESEAETEAVGLASALAMDIKNTPFTRAASTVYGITPMPWSAAVGGVRQNAQAGQVWRAYYGINPANGRPEMRSGREAWSRYAVELAYTHPITALAGNRETVEARLTLYWPARSVEESGGGLRPTDTTTQAYTVYLTIPYPGGTEP